MIVAVCADKGSPGVTTLAMVLGMVWPGERLVLEADPSGGDLAFRARHVEGGGLLAAEPTVLSLAADARTGLPDGTLAQYAQPTTVGVPVIHGPPGAAAFVPMRGLWPVVASEAARWSGTVIADLGRLQPGNAALPLAKAATAVLVLAQVSVESLYHLRERVQDLSAIIGDPSRERHPVAVVVAARRGDDRALTQVRRMLDAVGSPIPVAGVLATDPAAAEALRTGEIRRGLDRSDLIRSAAELAGTLLTWWPQLADPPLQVGHVDRRDAGGTPWNADRRDRTAHRPFGPGRADPVAAPPGGGAG